MTKQWHEFIYESVFIIFLVSGVLITLFIFLGILKRLVIRRKKNRHLYTKTIKRSPISSHVQTKQNEDLPPYTQTEEHYNPKTNTSSLNSTPNNGTQPQIMKSRISEKEQAQLKEIIQDVKANHGQRTQSSPILKIWEKLLSHLDDIHIHKAVLLKKNTELSICHYHNFAIDTLLYVEKKLNQVNGKLKHVLLDIIDKQKRVCLTGEVSLSSDSYFLFEDSERGQFDEIYLLPFKTQGDCYVLILMHHKTHAHVSKEHLNQFLRLYTSNQVRG